MQVSWSNFDRFSTGLFNSVLQADFNFESLRKSMMKKWRNMLVEVMNPTSSHFRIGAGNYSYYFLLNNAYGLKMRYPYLPMSIELMEFRSLESLKDSGIHIVFAGIYFPQDYFSNRFSELNDTGYIFGKKILKDAAFFAVSAEVLQEYESKAAVLKKHDLLQIRLYESSKKVGNLPKAKVPAGREKEIPRVTMDQMFATHLLMKAGIGVWRVYQTLQYDESIAPLEAHPHELVSRLFFYHAPFDMRHTIFRNKFFRQLPRINFGYMENVWNQGGAERW